MISRFKFAWVTLLASSVLYGSKQEFSILRDIAYTGSDNPHQTLDLYTPRSLNLSSGKLPVVVWIHGGAWKSGSKKSGNHPHRIPEIVATQRYAGVSIGYRLSQDVKWPAQIHDCKAAIRWLRGNAKALGLDPDRIGVWGSSAGGHLASMLGTTKDYESLEGEIGDFRSFSSEVQAVVNYYGPSAFLRMDDQPGKIRHNAPGSPESQLIGHPIQEAKKLAQNASPLHHVSARDAPHFHFHGMQDSFVPYQQSLLLHHALQKEKVSSALISVQQAGHGMPVKFTQEFVIPFFDFLFHGVGTFPKDLSL
ncbi:MAG: alpha/beta hydrolase fold domain-containing protein [Opitutales bacterium]